MPALKVPDTIAELGECDAFENLYDRVPHLFHNAPNTADVFIGARAAFVEFLTNTTYRSKRTIDEPDDCSQGYLVWRQAEPITTRDTALAFKDAGRAQVIEDLFKESLRDVLLVGNRLNANDIGRGIEAEDNQGT
jgi:hypothetical protein